MLPEVALNNSVEALEYEFISAISKLTKNKKEKIAFLQGHGELSKIEVADLSHSVMQDAYNLSEYYERGHWELLLASPNFVKS